MEGVYDHIRITYLVKGGILAYALEVKTHVMNRRFSAASEISLMGFYPDHGTYIPPAAIIRIESCDDKGYTQKEKQAAAAEFAKRR